MKNLFAIFFLLLIPVCTLAQPFLFKMQVKNQPDLPVIFGKIKGDVFSPVDTFQIEKTNAGFSLITFYFPINSNPGVYRLVLGQTTYARVMNEAPQQIDFIFNKEDIYFETDFKSPTDSLTIIRSEENKTWFSFLKEEKRIQQEINQAEQELEYFRAKLNEPAEKEWIKKFNDLQNKRDAIIVETAKSNERDFVSKMIKMYRRPFLDGKFLKNERSEIFKNEFFKLLDFSDEKLMYSAVYSRNVFQYLMSFAQKGLTRDEQEAEFMRAVDLILAHVKHNPNRVEPKNTDLVYEFILDYLVRGFERLNQEKLIEYIAENYAGTTCQTDEKTTLERKLEAAKMKMGTFVPDFQMKDINGDFIRFSEIQKDTTVLVFWASWCSHCCEMLPEIKRWHPASELKNTEIVLVSLDTSPEDWKNFVYNHNLDVFYNFCDFQEWEGKTAIDYNVFATPTIFVLNKELKILGKPITLTELKNLLD